MSTKYIINNSDLILPFQEINADLNIVGGLSSTTISATTLYVGGNSIARPYKVYTALLTQSGGDDPNVISGGSVTAGVTYEIVVSSTIGVWDFSNVGGPVYPETYTFVATASDVPNSWEGVDDLNYNNGAPVPTVLENTLGNIWFTYQDSGFYRIESKELFTLNKSTFYFGAARTDEGFPSIINTFDDYTINNYPFYTFHDSGLVDNVLFNTPIEIRVYE